MEIRHLTAWGLANGITEARRKDIKAWKNPYSEGLCRRARDFADERENFPSTERTPKQQLKRLPADTASCFTKKQKNNTDY